MTIDAMVRVPLRLLVFSTPVGPLGSGLGGGVELTLSVLSQELARRGHGLRLVAPAGSELGTMAIEQVPGAWQPTAHTQAPQAPIVLPPDSVLGTAGTDCLAAGFSAGRHVGLWSPGAA